MMKMIMATMMAAHWLKHTTASIQLHLQWHIFQQQPRKDSQQMHRYDLLYGSSKENEAMATKLLNGTFDGWMSLTTQAWIWRSQAIMMYNFDLLRQGLLW